MKRKPKILVVGSFVKDLIVTTSRFPKAGETVLGDDFQTASGGKGANQAIQAARLGAEVTIVGKVGDDTFGKEMILSCQKSGIDCTKIIIDKTTPSSIGNVQIERDENGLTQNRIIVVPGANMKITKQDVDFLKDEIALYDMVLLQLEIPMEINKLIVDFAWEKNIPVMLNSAPYDDIDDEILRKITYISPNEFEASLLSGHKIRRSGEKVNAEDVKIVINKIMEKGVKNVLVTLGSAGAAFGNKDEFIMIPTIMDVNVVDPTAAGDSFVGAFSTLVAMGKCFKDAIEISNYVGSLTVATMGAQPSLPNMKNLIEFMGKYSKLDLLTN